MDLEAILRLIRAAEETTFDKFELSDAEFELKLERRNYRFAVEREGSPLFLSGTRHGEGAVEATQLAEKLEAEAVEDEFMDSKEIKSPLLGVFHQLPDGKAVRAGDKVKKGDIICMVEAMKLMNEIMMPEDGEIVWVAVNDNTMVEYGDLLYRYAASDNT